LSPIVLFVYNRCDHTKRTIEALKNNELADESELIIYADGAKDADVFPKVQEVRDYIKTISGFKKIIIIERDNNYGLANSIIKGVTEVVNKHDRVIVLEDDIVTSPYFLKFMNDALDFYKDKKKVWHVSGWSYPIETDGLNDIFLWRLMNCWGWATWADRWQYFEKDTDKLISEFTSREIYRFDLDGVGSFWDQVLLNRKGKIDTWAIYWYAAIFKKGGLCVNPSKSFVENIGHDGSGVHCKEGHGYNSNLSLARNIEFSDYIRESEIAVNKVRRFYKIQKQYHYKAKINKFFKRILGPK